MVHFFIRDQNDPADNNGPKRTKMDQKGLKLTIVDQYGTKITKKFYFGPFWSSCPILSDFRPIWSILVQYGPFCPIWSILIRVSNYNGTTVSYSSYLSAM
jgi:hypothetical protein